MIVRSLLSSLCPFTLHDVCTWQPTLQVQLHLEDVVEVIEQSHYVAFVAFVEAPSAGIRLWEWIWRDSCPPWLINELNSSQLCKNRSSSAVGSLPLISEMMNSSLKWWQLLGWQCICSCVIPQSLLTNMPAVRLEHPRSPATNNDDPLHHLYAGHEGGSICCKVTKNLTKKAPWVENKWKKKPHPHY